MSGFPRCLPNPRPQNTPTCAARRLYEPEEPAVSNKVKRIAANTAIKLGAVGAIVAVVVVADQLMQTMGRRWQ